MNKPWRSTRTWPTEIKMDWRGRQRRRRRRWWWWWMSIYYYWIEWTNQDTNYKDLLLDTVRLIIKCFQTVFMIDITTLYQFTPVHKNTRFHLTHCSKSQAYYSPMLAINSNLCHYTSGILNVCFIHMNVRS